MKEIVTVEENELVVSIRDIAEFSGYKLESAISLLEKNSDRFNFDFPKGSYKVQSTLCLTERVATHLIVYMGNTEEVMKFKDNLIEQFFAMRNKLETLHTKELQQKDIQLEIVRKNLTEAIINKMKTYKDGFVSLRKYLKERGLNITEKQAWDILLDYGYTSEAEVTVRRTILNDHNLGRQETSTGVIEFNSRALDLVFKDFVEKSVDLLDFIEA